MTIISFALLAKAMHVIENKNDSNFVVVRHMIDRLSSQWL